MPPPYSEFVFPDLGGIRWWSVFLTIAILAGTWLAAREARRTGLDTRHVLPLLVLILPAGVIGARAWYVIFEWERRFADAPELVWQIWQGGVALHGAMLGGAIALTIYARRSGIGFWRWADAIAVAFPLSLAMARWGDYFNQQSFGEPTNLPWALPVDSFYRPLRWLESELPFHPTFLYEFGWDVAVFALVLVIAHRVRARRPGDVALISLAGYSAGRFFIEALRADAILVGDGWRLTMIVSAVLVGLGGAGLLIRHWRPRQGARRRATA